MISVVVLTADKSLSRTIGISKIALIPADIRQKHPDISIVSYPIDGSTTLAELASYFVGKSSSVNGVIVLCDNRFAHLARLLTTPLFTVIFDHTLAGKTLHNYLGMILSRVIRAFNSFAIRFDDQKYRKLLILPLRNFCADELRELHALFRNGVRPDGEFHNSIDLLLRTLRSRQRPKVGTTYQTIYIVDDKERFFEYGKEIHGKLETSVPPHDHLCAVTGIYRFGKRYDVDRHFNVSTQAKTISGVFEDCHGVSAKRAPCSHLNMFPNDFSAQTRCRNGPRAVKVAVPR
jgi:hypothetical protein